MYKNGFSLKYLVLKNSGLIYNYYQIEILIYDNYNSLDKKSKN